MGYAKVIKSRPMKNFATENTDKKNRERLTQLKMDSFSVGEEFLTKHNADQRKIYYLSFLMIVLWFLVNRGPRSLHCIEQPVT